MKDIFYGLVILIYITGAYLPIFGEETTGWIYASIINFIVLIFFGYLDMPRLVVLSYVLPFIVAFIKLMLFRT
jgi:hypothetical protein